MKIGGVLFGWARKLLHFIHSIQLWETVLTLSPKYVFQLNNLPNVHNGLRASLSFKTELSGLLRLTEQKLVTFQCRIVFFALF